MRQPQFTNRFKKDLKRQKKRGKQPYGLERIINTICETGDASSACRPHNLSGNWAGYRECHIESDWLLIYTVQDEIATFYRTGTHADLFD
ncbi:MAG: type II toxin-antitoxin system mRNA interferase toxin, RelE/StbE family [Desulfobulbaceae bacterium]|nr:type II toxin-antitoxin system mRNA interferase toxin, RelE/StbE family [Desulfobulbaceae bacterium]